MSSILFLSIEMKRALIAAGALILGGMPAMAGGIEGGVKNSYFNNFRTETINFGERHIEIDQYNEVSWEGETESHKSFKDFMGKVTGVEGNYSASEGVEVSKDSCGRCYGTKPGKGKGRDGKKGGSFEFAYDAGQELNVDFEDPKVQMTWSEGYTNTSMWAEGYDEVSTYITINEEYEGYSEQSEHGHEATSFASAF